MAALLRPTKVADDNVIITAPTSTTSKQTNFAETVLATPPGQRRIIQDDPKLVSQINFPAPKNQVDPTGNKRLSTNDASNTKEHTRRGGGGVVSNNGRATSIEEAWASLNRNRYGIDQAPTPFRDDTLAHQQYNPSVRLAAANDDLMPMKITSFSNSIPLQPPKKFQLPAMAMAKQQAVANTGSVITGGGGGEILKTKGFMKVTAYDDSYNNGDDFNFLRATKVDVNQQAAKNMKDQKAFFYYGVKNGSDPKSIPQGLVLQQPQIVPQKTTGKNIKQQNSDNGSGASNLLNALTNTTSNTKLSKLYDGSKIVDMIAKVPGQTGEAVRNVIRMDDSNTNKNGSINLPVGTTGVVGLNLNFNLHALSALGNSVNTNTNNSVVVGNSDKNQKKGRRQVDIKQSLSKLDRAKGAPFMKGGGLPTSMGGEKTQHDLMMSSGVDFGLNIQRLEASDAVNAKLANEINVTPSKLAKAGATTLITTGVTLANAYADQEYVSGSLLISVKGIERFERPTLNKMTNLLSTETKETKEDVPQSASVALSKKYHQQQQQASNRERKSEVPLKKPTPSITTTPTVANSNSNSVVTGNDKPIAKKPKKQEKPPTNIISDKEQSHNLKVSQYREWIFIINFSNGVLIPYSLGSGVPFNFTPYKYRVGRGNNSTLVKACLKRRWWWVKAEKDEPISNVNLLWTQWKDNDYLNTLKPHKKGGEPLQLQDSASTNNDNPSRGGGNPICETTTISERSFHEDQNQQHFLSEGCSDSDAEGPANKGLSRLGSSLKRENSLNREKIRRKVKNDDLDGEEYERNQKLLKIVTLQDVTRLNKKRLNFTGQTNEDDLDTHSRNLAKAHGLTMLPPNSIRSCNKLEFNFHLANKKGMYYNLKYYYEAMKENVYDHLPLTFHIQDGLEDKEFQKFLEYFNARQTEMIEQEKVLAQTAAQGQSGGDAKGPNKNANNAKDDNAEGKVKKIRNIWIIKPGENTNRGTGINVSSDLSEIKTMVGAKELHANGKKKTYIVQQYMDRPFLYNRRKFDIRCYMMITSVNGKMKGYWYQDGYIRTSSTAFTVKDLSNKMIHLTNDAIQKHGEKYGKFEAGNKLSYSEFQRYLDMNFPDAKYNFMETVYPKMKKMAKDSIQAVFTKIDVNKREHTFEVFGLDFMIDENFNTWMIEINTNPCLELSCPLLGRIIPTMVENALRIGLDPMFPPPQWTYSKRHLLPDNQIDTNKFELVFDEDESGAYLKTVFNSSNQPNLDEIYEIDEEEEEGGSGEESGGEPDND